MLQVNKNHISQKGIPTAEKGKANINLKFTPCLVIANNNTPVTGRIS